MIIAIPDNLRPTEHQREFVESDEPKLCFDGPLGSGKTHALLLAAVREAAMNPSHVLLVAGCDDSWTNFNKQAEIVFGRCGLENGTRRVPTKTGDTPKVIRQAWVWTTGHGRIVLCSVASTIPIDARYDMIGIDNADEFRAVDLEDIAEHLKPDGKLRMTWNQTRIDALRGRMIACPRENPYVVAP